MLQRIDYFDFLRGLAIVMVVGIHTYTRGEDSIAVRQIFNVAVPLFIAISGYFLSQKRMQDKNNYTAFLKKQLPKVYLPTLMWSVPFYVLALLEGNSLYLYTVMLFICGFSIYYFVAFIMQCYVALPVINRCMTKAKEGLVILSCLVSFFWIAGAQYVKTILDINLSLIYYAGPLPCWIMFFVLGMLIARKPDRRYSIIVPLALTIIGFALSVLETEYLLGHYGKGEDYKPSSYIYSAGMVFLLFSAKIETLFTRLGVVFRFLIWLGRLSFGIYLIHCYFIIFIIERLPIENWMLKCVSVLLLTILSILMLRKILPLRYHKNFGI